jgi:hypothetical protein
MNGAEIHNIFIEHGIKHGESFTFEDSQGRPKYVLKRQYEADTLASFGQSIDVKLPFRGELSREMLVNTAYLQEVMVKHGFRL